MTRYKSKVPDAQSIINKFNQLRAHKRIGLEFKDLEKLYICETNVGFPAPSALVLQHAQNQRGILPPLNLALKINTRYANKTPHEILKSLASHETRRSKARCQPQLGVWAPNDATQPGFQGQSTIQPQLINNFNGLQNPIAQLSAGPVVHPMDGMMMQEPGNQEQPTFEPQDFNYSGFPNAFEQASASQITQSTGDMMIQEPEILGQPTFQPQEYNYNGVQNHLEQLPMDQLAQPMGGWMIQELIEPQLAAIDDSTIDPVLCGTATPRWAPNQEPAARAANNVIVDDPILGMAITWAPAEDPDALAPQNAKVVDPNLSIETPGGPIEESVVPSAGNDHNNVLAAVAPGSEDVPALTRDISAESQRTSHEQTKEEKPTNQDSPLRILTDAEQEEWTKNFLEEYGYELADISKLDS
ncbi:hypothetical protein SLS60_003826 [Paraconiothyrium brasiliense]|uniref:MADS-box domain-containing protein n=1 Tax=Paraconiothyrium brasiliense TaxID=300254 RepID=A0ABR3RQ64_9PLEO